MREQQLHVNSRRSFNTECAFIKLDKQVTLSMPISISNMAFFSNVKWQFSKTGTIVFVIPRMNVGSLPTVPYLSVTIIENTLCLSYTQFPLLFSKKTVQMRTQTHRYSHELANKSTIIAAVDDIIFIVMRNLKGKFHIGLNEHEQMLQLI